MEPRRRLTASGVLFVLAVTAFFGTLLFWWLGSLPGHFIPEVGREVFGNISPALQALFYIGIAAFLPLTLYLFSLRARNWERGTGEDRTGRWAERLKAAGAGLAMKTLLRDRAAGFDARHDLLRVHRPVPGHGHSGDRPSASHRSSSSWRATPTRSIRPFSIWQRWCSSLGLCGPLSAGTARSRGACV